MKGQEKGRGVSGLPGLFLCFLPPRCLVGGFQCPGRAHGVVPGQEGGNPVPDTVDFRMEFPGGGSQGRVSGRDQLLRTVGSDHADAGGIPAVTVMLIIDTFFR